MTHVLTDNGSCFTQAFAKVCVELRAEYRHIKPRTPQTNGMVERFNGRIGSEVLAITIYSHDQLEQLLRFVAEELSPNQRPDAPDSCERCGIGSLLASASLEILSIPRHTLTTLSLALTTR